MQTATRRRVNVPQVAHLAAMLAKSSPANSAPYASARDATRLCAIGRALSRLDEKACNVGTTGADERRVTRLLEEAAAILEPYGLLPYHQGDPRGASLYVYNPSELDGRDVHSVYSGIGTAAY